jgi:hypothetical protein
VVVASNSRAFAPTVLRGLAQLGPVVETDLALELGLSAWMSFGGMGAEDARTEMHAIRQAVLEVSGLDAATEAIPFRGRSARSDVLNLAVYLGNLVERAARSAGCPPEALIERAIARLPHVRDSAA